MKLESVFAKKAKENLSSGGKGLSISTKVDTREEIAKIAGLGNNTIHKVKAIEQKASSETKEKLRTQEISVNLGDATARMFTLFYYLYETLTNRNKCENLKSYRN